MTFQFKFKSSSFVLNIDVIVQVKKKNLLKIPCKNIAFPEHNSTAASLVSRTIL